MIIDTHIHYSEPDSPDRSYDPEFVATYPNRTLTKGLLVEELVGEASQAGVDKVVQVTQTKMGYDNRYSLEGAARYPDKILGVIGRFDPLAPDIEARLAVFAAQPFMLGVRYTLLTQRTGPWLRDRVLDGFFAAAEKLDVAVQIFAPYRGAEMRNAARRFPGIRFLIDHMALNHAPPRPLDDVFRGWRDVLKLAEEPNVWIKVSYFPEAARFSEHYPFPGAQQRFRELYEHVGAQRLVWGSNFPPVAKACTYREALDFVRTHCNFLSTADRDAILGENFLAHFVKRKRVP